MFTQFRINNLFERKEVKMAFFNRISGKNISVLSAALLMCVGVDARNGEVQAQGDVPSLIITNAPLPESLRDKLYAAPSKVREIRPTQLSGGAYRNDGAQTLVTQKIKSLGMDLQSIDKKIEALSDVLNAIRNNAESKSADYYANIGTINTQLRSGTTPGNPRLVSRVERAQQNLEELAAIVADLNNQAVNITAVASEGAFLLETAQSTYNVAGAVEEDHVKLSNLEDRINKTMVNINRLLNTVNDEITRTSAYLSSEQNNLRVLALAVSNGDMYGRSLSRRPFSGVANVSAPVGMARVQNASVSLVGMTQMGAPSSPETAADGRRALAKIIFDAPEVEYEQALYVAVNEALDRYPDAVFDLVAVHPVQGNAAEVAIQTTRARRNAEGVLRTLTQMGLPSERIEMSYDGSESALSSEVHVYVR